MMAALLTLCLASVSHAKNTQTIIIEHVNVVPMDRDRVLRDRALTVVDGVISSIAAQSPHLPGATIIDGMGGYLIPGMADMHVHSSTSRDMKLFLANGVTTVLNMGGASTTFVDQIVPKVNRGELPGPHVYLGLRVDGTPEFGQLVVATPAQARATVALAKTNGYDFIKVYNNLAPATFDAFIDEGKKEGLPVVGHGVTRVGIRRQLAEGQLMVAHLEEYLYTVFFRADEDVGNKAPSIEQIPEAVTFTKRANAFVTADLATYATIAAQWGKPAVVRTYLAMPTVRYLDPDDRIAWRHAGYDGKSGSLDDRLAFLRKFANALADADVPLIIGTDTPTLPGLVPGFSVLEDVRQLEQAGLTPFQALSAATRNPGLMIARAKPHERCFGVILAGCRADLVLTATNPLTDLGTLATPRGVLAGGHWYDADHLARLLASVEHEYQ